MKWFYRENLLVKQGSKERFKFILNTELNEPDDLVEIAYNKLKANNQEIFFYTFIKAKDFTYVTIAGDDFNFVEDEGDVLREDWQLKYGFSYYWDLDKDGIQLQSTTDEWIKMKETKVKDIGSFDYFYKAEYFK